ncbi:hypothetical protein DHEL01_v203476 [Diaporthe helianthi]|uniref:Uncharacterized protein n=1 Tax=Diaporthe helianthi TaxID=158607 RepID=A0A2P5I6J6_DIAHE|nr:hypothetical protein DHEL01_v203476 [Diaporthe helianthi]
MAGWRTLYHPEASTLLLPIGPDQCNLLCIPKAGGPSYGGIITTTVTPKAHAPDLSNNPRRSTWHPASNWHLGTWVPGSLAPGPRTPGHIPDLGSSFINLVDRVLWDDAPPPAAQHPPSELPPGILTWSLVPGPVLVTHLQARERGSKPTPGFLKHFSPIESTTC